MSTPARSFNVAGRLNFTDPESLNDNPQLNIPMVGVANAALDNPAIGAVAQKLHANGTVTIKCYGDETTYGKQTGGPTSAINGSAVLRTAYPYPESLKAALSQAFPSATITVSNKGYPGDMSAQGITRWAAEAACDLAIFMYGTNDAKDYGGLGGQTIEQFRSNMTELIARERQRGSAILILLPPQVDGGDDRVILPYHQAAQQVADRWGVPWIDSRTQLKPIPTAAMWSDSVNLTAAATNCLGWDLAGLFVNRDVGHRVYRPGETLRDEDMGIGYIGLSTDAGRKTVYMGGGAQLHIGLNLTEQVIPTLIYQNLAAGTNRGLRLDQRGNNLSRPGSAVSTTWTAPGGTDSRAIQRLGQLEPGIRYVTLTTLYSNDLFMESIRLMPVTNQVQFGIEGFWKPSLVAGAFRPRGVTGYFVAADYQRYLASPFSSGKPTVIRATMTLGDQGEHGIGVVQNEDVTRDMLTDGVFVMRKQASMIVRRLVAGVATDTTVGAIFPASGQWTGEIGIMFGGSGNVYGLINGVGAVTATGVTIQSGYAAMGSNAVSAGDDTCVCTAMMTFTDNH